MVCRRLTCPTQLQQVVQVESRRHLKSSSSSALVVPATRRSSLGDRAFSVAAARAWNSLPPTVASTLFIPPSAENSSIYCVFPVVSMILSIFWVSSTSLSVLGDLVLQSSDFMPPWSVRYVTLQSIHPIGHFRYGDFQFCYKQLAMSASVPMILSIK